MSHLKSSSKCSWYRKGKRMELGATGRAEQEMLEAERAHTILFFDDDQPPLPPASSATGSSSDSGSPHPGPSGSSATGGNGEDDTDIEDNDPEVVEQAFHDELFEFIPADPIPDMMDVDEAGPSSSQQNRRPGLQLDDDDDERVVDEYPGAAQVIRMDHTLHKRWRKRFGGRVGGVDGDPMVVSEPSDNQGDNPFAPFASEMDWRVASWAVKDGIGHKSFDRLLAIPGV